MLGADAYIRLLDDVYFTLKDVKDAEVLILGADERKNFPGVVDCVQRIQNAGIRTRLVVEEGNDYILGNLEDYRQIPSEYFSNSVTVIYGDKFAILIEHSDGPRVHVVNNLHLARAQGRFFEFIWKNGHKPEITNASV